MATAKGGFVKQENVRALFAQTKNAERLVEERALVRVLSREEYQRAERIRFLILSAIISLLTAFVGFRIRSLQYVYPKAYQWWSSSSGYLDPSFAPPSGPTNNITVPSCALQNEYPGMAIFQQLTMSSGSISTQGALFLLLMAEHYGTTRNLKGIHWSGSGEQLGEALLPQLLPTHTGKNWTLVWTKWNSTNVDGQPINPWANTIWKSATDMAYSPIFSDYFDNKKKAHSIVRSLFHGGLTYVATTHFTDSTTAYDMVRYLVGSIPQTVAVPCSAAQKRNHAFETATMIGAVATLPMMFLHGETMSKHGIKLALGLTAAGAGAGAGLSTMTKCSTGVYATVSRTK